MILSLIASLLRTAERCKAKKIEIRIALLHAPRFPTDYVTYDNNLKIVLYISFGAGAKPSLVLGDSSTLAFTVFSNNGVSVLRSR